MRSRRDKTSACVASDPLRALPRLLHGARINSPASGSTRKATAISAGTSNGAGTDREAPPRAARLARSRCCQVRLRRDGSPWRLRNYGQGFWNPAAESTCWPAGDST